MTLDVSEIAPRLWIGSAPPQGPTLAQHGFDVLVLCATDWQPPPETYPGVDVLQAPFRDQEDVSPEEVQLAIAAAEWTADRLVSGAICLVTCAAGRNRSGLVCALVVSLAAGWDPAKAGELVRRKRGSAALTNARFVDVLNQLRDEACELCEAARVTRRYYEDSLCWVADCKSCACPLVVMRRHSIKPTRTERHAMLELLKQAAKPGVRYALDEERRSIPAHWHAHLRPVHA